MTVVSPKKSNKIYAVFTILSVIIFALFFSSSAIANANTPSVSSYYDEIIRLNDMNIKVTNASFHDKIVELTLKCKLMSSFSTQLYPKVTKVTFDGLSNEYKFETGEKVDDYSQCITVLNPPEKFEFMKVVVSSSMPDTIVEDSYNEFGELVKGKTVKGKVYSATVIIDKKDMANKHIEIIPAHKDDSLPDEFDTMTLATTTTFASAATSNTSAATTTATTSATTITTTKIDHEGEQAHAVNQTTTEENNHDGEQAYNQNQNYDDGDNHYGEPAYNPNQTYTQENNHDGEQAYNTNQTATGIPQTTTGAAVMRTTTTRQTTQAVVHCSGIKLITDFENNNILLEINKSSVIKAEVTPSSSADKSVRWSSNREDIAKVDDNGKVTAVSKGKAIITATTSDGGLTASCMVTVN